jgi:hypothetical protein
MDWADEAHEQGVVRWVADILPRAERCAGWDLVRGFYRQQVDIRESGSRRVPEELRDALIDAIFQVSMSYVGEEEQMCELALAVLAAVEGYETIDLDLVRRFYEDDRFAPYTADSSRQRCPSVFEAIVETCRRRRDARHLSDVVEHASTTVLRIGSTAYGRFSNVRGNRCGEAASDLDVIVIEKAEALCPMVDKLAALPGVTPADIDQFAHRVQVFVDGFDDGKTVFSHKIRLWANGTPDPLLPPGVARADYLVSLHVMTPPVLEHVLVAATPRLRKESAGTHRTVQDYRATASGRRERLYTFGRRGYYLPLKTKCVKAGYLTLPSVYYIDEFDHYCPGFYQTMLFPPPDLLWDGRHIQPALDEFWGKIAERIQYEGGKQVHAMLRPSFAHVRREAFTSTIIKQLDEGYWRS